MIPTHNPSFGTRPNGRLALDSIAPSIVASSLAPALARAVALIIALLTLPSLAAAQHTTVTLTPAGDPAPPWAWPGGPTNALVLSGTSDSPYAITGIAQVDITMTHSFVGDAHISLEFTPSTGPGAGAPIKVDILNRLGLTPSFGSVGYSSNLGGSYIFIDPPAGQNTLAIMTNNTNFVLPSGSYRAYGTWNVPTTLSTSLAGVIGTGTWRLSFRTPGMDGGFGGPANTVSAASVTFTSGGCPGAWSALGSGAVGSFAKVLLPSGEVMMGDAGRYNPTTNTWTPLATRTNGGVNALAVTATGDVIVGGQFTTAGGNAASNIARYNPTTGVWSTLGTGTNNTVYAVVALPGGDVIAGGTFTSAGGVPVNKVARYNPTTNTWSAMGTGLIGSSSPAGPVAYAMAMLPSGLVVIAGDFYSGNGIGAGGFIRYNPTTGVWTSTAGPGIASYVAALTVLPGGDVIAGGTAPVFPPAGGSYLLGRYNPTTNVWTGLGAFTSGIVGSLSTLPGGDVVVGGTFPTAGGVTVNGIGRCNPNTDVWTGLGAGVGFAGGFPPSSNVFALPGGDVIASGNWTSVGGVAVNGIARYTFGSPAPSITAQPQSLSICTSGTAHLSVAASGTSLAYQWQWRPTGGQFANVIDGVNTDPQGGPIQFTATGARTGTVSIENAGGTGTAGSHWEKRCIVTSVCGSVTSDAATLTICAADFNCDGFLDFTDFDGFVTAFEAGDTASDFNADGFIDFTDFDAFVSAFEAGC